MFRDEAAGPCGLRVGAVHADTLAARHGLHHWQGEAGDPAGAAEGFTTLLRHTRRILDPDHAGTDCGPMASYDVPPDTPRRLGCR